MKNLKLEEMGLIQLNEREMLNTEGGGFWKWLGSALAYVAFAFALGGAVAGSGNFEFGFEF
ncbi:MAG: hypothetical protein LW721_17370 [Flammeovirgaceae bacterium]|jgi:hypothetical protein|nr:hypothetical protein [Flammeovirgaceae bacterium]